MVECGSEFPDKLPQVSFTATLYELELDSGLLSISTNEPKVYGTLPI
jgi:hypothetical protein